MKRVIIIGGSSGIGEQLARLFFKAGYKTAVTGRRESLLKDIVKEHHDEMICSVFDVQQTESIEKNLDELSDRLGGCDLLLISAGTGDINEELNFNTEKDIIDTNVSGFTCAADWAFRFFQKQGSGHLAAISSVAGIRGFRSAPAYGASKSYQIRYLEALKQKAKHSRLPITVTDIRPGFVNTKMAKGPGQFWVSSPEKAAAQIFNAIKHKRETVYVTKRWRMIGLILKILPGFIHGKL